MLVFGFLGAAAFQLVPGAVIAADPPAAAGEVRATKFVLVDPSGKPLAMLGGYDAVYAKGDINPPPVRQMTGLVVLDADGQPGVQLGVGGGVSRLEMKGDVGWMTLGVHPDGGGVGIWVPQETLRMGLGFQRDGNAGFIFRDLQSRDRLSAGMPPHAGVSMSLKGDNGQTLWSAP